MDRHDYEIASSLIGTGGRPPRAPAPTSRGGRSSVAQLLNDHDRYASHPEDRRFLEDTLGPTLGITTTTTTTTTTTAAGPSWGKEHVLPWEVTGASANGPVPPLHRWLAVHAAISVRSGDEKTESGGVGHGRALASRQRRRVRWTRVDALVEAEALLPTLDGEARVAQPCARPEHNEGAGPDEVGEGAESTWADRQRLASALRDYHLLAPCAGGGASGGEGETDTPSTAGAAMVSAAGVGDAGLRTSFGFFTFTQDEYAALPAPCADRDGIVDEELTSLTAVMKLTTLYARLGSFVAVADRWPYTDARGERATAPSPTTAPRPSVEALCAVYQWLTQGIMRQRVGRLRAALLTCAEANTRPPSDTTTPSPTAPADPSATTTTTAAAAAARLRVSQHPLMVLLLRHPLLGGVEAEDASVTASPAPVGRAKDSRKRPREGRDKDDGKDHDNDEEETEAEGGETREGEEPTQGGLPGLTRALAEERAEGGRPARLLRVLATPTTTTNSRNPADTPSGWYDAQGERARRACLSALLARESAVNVPYQRVAAAYLALVPRALHVLQRLQALVGSGGESGSDRSVDGCTSAVGIVAARLVAPLASARGFQLRLRELPDVDPVAWAAAELAIRQQQHQQQPSSSDATAASLAADGGLLRALTEVFDEVPVACRRLVGAAQAGWLLGPPPTLPTPSPASGTADGEGGAVAGTTSPSTTTATTGPHGLSAESAQRWMATVSRAGVCNRAYSMLSEAVLVTLPRAVPRLHREVEEVLEKFLSDDAAALMDSAPAVVCELVPALRVTYMQNILLKRTLGRLEGVLDAMQKVEAAAVAATVSGGGAAPSVTGEG